MKKKLLKILGIVFLLIVLIAVAAPFFLEAKIGTILRNNVNSSINGTFDFDEAGLSLIRSFPDARLTVRGMYIINNSPFEGDTLLKSEEVSLTLGLMELFKGQGEPIGISDLRIDKAKLNILTDSLENANYDIAISAGNQEDGDQSDAGFSLDLQSYSITNSDITYTDRASGIEVRFEDIQHEGNGDLSLATSELETTTTALLSFSIDGTNYLNRNSVQLKALLGIDLNENKYTFLQNEALLNQLPMVFDGYIQLFDDYQEYDIQFGTPSSDFRNFLAVIPETYTKSIEGVTTTGDFKVEGTINGKLDDTHIPPFSVLISSANASFKYPDLPKAVRNIQLDALVKNTTGLAEDTFVEINKASFMIDSDQFSLDATIRELMGNTKVNARLKGSLHLANLSAAYPVPSDLNLKGLLKADITTAFDMASVEKKQYERTKTSGFFNLSNFEYSSGEMANPVTIESLTMDFNPKTVTLREMSGWTGKTDFKAGGTIQNLLGYLFNNELIEGNFNLTSDTFILNDFMVKEDQKTDEGSGSAEDRLKIPAFLDCTVQAAANTVYYDNLTLRNVSGTLRIKDETATLSNMTSSIFDGKLALSGTVSTKEERPAFSMNLGMNSFRISETFQSLELLQTLAPVASALEGRLTSQVDISGLLTEDLTPDFATITGNVLAQLVGTQILPEKAAILNALGNKLNFINARDFDLKELKTALSFENGQVKVKPFTVKYKDIAIDVQGGHGFDRTLNYTATLQVPAKYLGGEVNNLIARIDDQQLQNLSIPVSANIGGNYSSPTVSTDLTSGVKNLTAQLVEIQKQKLVNQGKAKAQDLIGGLLSGTATKDSTRQNDSTRTSVEQALGGLLRTGTQARDTAAVSKDTAAAPGKEPVVQEAAKQILGGILGKKKKEAQPVSKDTVN